MTHEVVFASSKPKNLEKLIWITDLHLDAADKDQHRRFFELIKSHEPSAVLIGGDISNGVNSLTHLKHLSHLIVKPLYFVLGNHDFYYGSISEIRKLARQATDGSSTVHYLTEGGVIQISRSTALIGHDGWSDGRAGDFFDSDVMLNDYYLIQELKEITPEERLQKLHELGSEAAEYIKQTLKQALQKAERVLMITHVPPFEEACVYEGNPCDPNWAPHFVCQAMGEALLEVMQDYPDKHLLVLCGHSHSAADVNILPNLHVVTGHSQLGVPQVQGIIWIE